MKTETRSNKLVKFTSVAMLTALLSACATSSLDRRYEENYDEARKKQALMTVPKSVLAGRENIDEINDTPENPEGNQFVEGDGFRRLEAMPRQDIIFSSQRLEERFSESQMVKVAANKMPLQDYIHYVFGEILDVNYLLTPAAGQINSPVTVNIAEEITARRLFALSQQVLTDRKLTIKFNGDVYLVSVMDPKSKSSRTVGIGRDIQSIPEGTDNILQIVPVLYGIKASLKTTVEQLSDVSVALDARQSALFINGTRENIARALELVQLLDSPANRGRHIGLVKLQFSSIDLYLSQISKLLDSEGIPNGINDPASRNLVFIPLYQIGAVAVFAASESLLSRVEYWTKTLDQPVEGDVNQYYIFHPRFARAKDIGDSLKPLISGGNQTQVRSSARSNARDRSEEGSGQLEEASRVQGASSSDLTFVVDERTNGIIFYTTGTRYKSLLPLINTLDVLPKQVMLEMVIAEVTLTDRFRFGLDFALKSGNFGFDTSYGVEAIGGGVLNWASGLNSATLEAISSDSLVNILSNPSLLVRDGVSATIDVGSQIPVVGSVVTDGGGGNTRSVNYLDTGVLVDVTPTINAQGVVIMNITTTSSNNSDAEPGAEGNPVISKRTLSTEVVAESGQTIIMGGLISEDVTDADAGIPGLREIPLLGSLFGTTSQSKIKKELVIMVTPKVISRTDQWDGLMDVFRNNIDNIRID